MKNSTGYYLNAIKVILKTRHVTIYTQLGENGEKHTGCNLCLNLIGWDDDEWDKHSVDYDDCHE